MGELGKKIRRRNRELLFEAYLKGKFHGEPFGDAAAGEPQSDVRAEAESERKKLFSEIPRIEGEHIVLDRVVDGDANALRDLMDNPNVQRFLPTFLFENQREDVHETIRLLYGNLYENKESLILAVRMKDTGDLAGLFELYGLRDNLHKISLGCRLRECYWGNGIATEAVKSMVDYLYGETDIQIITASVMVGNYGSARTLEKCDFIRTARNVEEDWGFTESAIVDKFFY